MSIQTKLVATKYAKEKIMQNESGIRITLAIPSHELLNFIKGERVRGYPTIPDKDSVPTLYPLAFFPKGATEIRIDPDKFEVDEVMANAFWIKRKEAPSNG